MIIVAATPIDPPEGDLCWRFHLINGANGTGCAVPSDAPGGDELLTRLQKLPGFNNEEFIHAMSSTRDARFVLWQAGR